MSAVCLKHAHVQKTQTDLYYEHGVDSATAYLSLPAHLRLLFAGICVSGKTYFVRSTKLTIAPVPCLPSTVFPITKPLSVNNRRSMFNANTIWDDDTFALPLR